jgi:hypothetical protein
MIFFFFFFFWNITDKKYGATCWNIGARPFKNYQQYDKQYVKEEKKNEQFIRVCF